MTNLNGFYWYIASLVLANIAIFAINVHFQPRRYLLSFNPAKDTLTKDNREASGSGALSAALRYGLFFIEGAQEMAFGYVLWWTLWTAIIHGERFDAEENITSLIYCCTRSIRLESNNDTFERARAESKDTAE